MRIISSSPLAGSLIFCYNMFMSYRKFQTYFFLAILTFCGVLTLLVFSPYLTLLAFGGVLSVVSRPVFSRIHSILKSDTAAAFLTIVVVVTVIVLPTAFFFAALSVELASVYTNLRGAVGGDDLITKLQSRFPQSWHDELPMIVDQFTGIVSAIASSLSKNLVGVFSNVVNMFFGFVVVMISTYYLLKDGAKIKRELLVLSPLSDEHDELVFNKVVTAVGAVMNGMLIVGLVKGVLSSGFFWMFGVPAPLFWGAMSGFASLIPLFGSGIVTIPAVAYLFVTGNISAAIGLTLVSIGLIGTVDNFLQPKLVESKTRIHPLLILLSIIGGLRFYGFAGFILGPLTIASLMALMDIYKKEFRVYVERGENGGDNGNSAGKSIVPRHPL